MEVLQLIPTSDILQGKKVIYPWYIVYWRPGKDEPWSTRITFGGNQLDYYVKTTTHTASMENIKCLLNIIVSNNGSKGATGDIGNMYLESELP